MIINFRLFLADEACMAVNSSSERDPRTDPRAGDSLRSGEIEWRVVGYAASLERIEVMEFKDGQFMNTRWPLPTFFLQWAQNATIVNRSEDVISDLLAIDVATRRESIELA